MIQLYIENKLVNYDDRLNINLTKEFQDPAELIIKDITYSYTIQLPTTLQNKQIFEFADNIDVRNKFNKVYNAQLYVNDNLIMNGKFTLNEINAEYYSGNLYIEGKKDLKDVLGDKNLNEIKPHFKTINSWSDINKINNYVGNLSTSSSALPPVNERDNHIMFPYVLYNLPYNKPTATNNKYIQYLDERNNLDFNYTFPAFNCLSVIKDMFADAGYNVVGNIFSDARFTGLYQSYSNKANTFREIRETPYFCRFNLSYATYRNKTIDPKLATRNCLDNFEVGTTAMLLAGSNNASFTLNETLDNPYKMLTKANDRGERAVIVPQSGWYKLNCKGQMNYPADGGSISQGGKQTVTGLYNDGDRTDLSRNIFEFHITKGLPLSIDTLVSLHGISPSRPVDYSTGEDPTLYCEPATFNNIINKKVRVCQDYSKQNSNLFPKNGKTSLITSYSGFDVGDFIAGARLGCPFQHPQADADRIPNRRKIKVATACLPHTGASTTLINDYKFNYNFIDGSRADYGYATALVMLKNDQLCNFEGFNTLDFETGKWDTTSNVGAKSYIGGQYSSASVSSVKAGKWDINTIVWLEAGDNINLELFMPKNDYRTKCQKVLGIGCDWKDRAKQGITQTNCDLSFFLAFINNNKDWTPNTTNPIPNDTNLTTSKQTNVNSLLPAIKCNEYLNKFLETFNLKLTNINANTYSIDFTQQGTQSGKTIKIDEYAHPSQAKYIKLDIPSSISLKWKIDKNEEGYVNGDEKNTAASAFQNLDWNKKEYEGSALFNNPANTSGSITKKESLFTFTWCKNINIDNKFYEVPVITDSKIWENGFTYETALAEGFYTDKNFRLFYIQKDPRYSNASAVKFLTDYTTTNGNITNKTYTNLLLVSNALAMEKSVSGSITTVKNFLLDFNQFNKTFAVTANGTTTRYSIETITDDFFDINLASTYQVDVPIILPNHLFHEIKNNTLVMFNDGLYRVKMIEGHDVNEENEGTLSLLSLN